MFEKGKSGNPKGRPKREDSLNKTSNRELKNRELLMLLRKIKPHVADAIMQSAKIMKNADAAHASQLKAASILLEHYRRLTLDLYDGADPDEEGEEIQQQNAPVFSLRVLEDGEEKAA